MLADLKIFEHKEPELVVAWNDSQTEARGWLVINSLRGGAAGGGTRMKKGLDLQEVLLLAKTIPSTPARRASSGAGTRPSYPC